MRAVQCFQYVHGIMDETIAHQLSDDPQKSSSM